MLPSPKCSMPAPRHATARAEAGSATASRPVMKRYIPLVMPTRSSAGTPTMMARRAWSVACMASASIGRSVAKACFRAGRTPRRWRSPGWSPPCARVVPRYSTASSSRRTLLRWARWRSARNATCLCWHALNPARFRPLLPRKSAARVVRRWQLATMLVRRRRARCQKPLPRSWRMPRRQGLLPRLESSSRIS